MISLMNFTRVAPSSILVMTYWGIIMSTSSCLVLITWRVLISMYTCARYSLWDVITSFLQGASVNNSMRYFFCYVEWRVTSFGCSGVDKDKLYEQRALPTQSWRVTSLILQQRYQSNVKSKFDLRRSFITQSLKNVDQIANICILT